MSLLEIRNLKKYFPVEEGLLARRKGDVKAVDGVSLTVEDGETLGVVGESGCGKSTLGPDDPPPDRAHGRRDPVREQGHHEDLQRRDARSPPAHADHLPGPLRLAQSPHESRRDHRRGPQDPPHGNRQGPQGAGDGTAREGGLAGRPLRPLPPRIQRRPAAAHRHRPGPGGVAQVQSSRTSRCRPWTCPFRPRSSTSSRSCRRVCSSPSSSSPTTFGWVEHVSHRVAIMYLGKVVEIAPSNAIYTDARHPYTRALLSAVPMPDPNPKKDRMVLEGDVPSPVNPPTGCNFHPRCPFREQICSEGGAGNWSSPWAATAPPATSSAPANAPGQPLRASPDGQGERSAAR